MLLAFSKVLKIEQKIILILVSLVFQSHIASTVCTLNNFICILKQKQDSLFVILFLFAKGKLHRSFIHLWGLNCKTRHKC